MPRDQVGSWLGRFHTDLRSMLGVGSWGLDHIRDILAHCEILARATVKHCPEQF